MTLIDAVPATVLAVFAHPDDAEAACGASLARWASGGSEVTIVVCTRGDKGSSDPQADPEQLALVRHDEAKAAARKLGAVGHVQLEYLDGEVDHGSEFRAKIVRLIREFRPVWVVCPDPTATIFGQHYVNHRDHRQVGWAVVDAAAHEAGSPHYWPAHGDAFQPTEIWLAGTLEPDTWVDVSTTIDLKAQALLCHKTQLDEPGEWLRTVVRERAKEAGRQAKVAYAESFRRIVLSPS